MKQFSLSPRRSGLLIKFAFVIALSVCCVSDANAQVVAAGKSASKPKVDEAVKKYGVWNWIEDDSGDSIQTMYLRVYPKAATIPAFRHRLVPAANDRVDGNAALFYLKAGGFFEQNNAREELTKRIRKWQEEASEQGLDDYAPYSWMDMAPESLPMEQVREYLELHHFQQKMLYDAARRTRFEHDRAMEREPNPIGYLLPSIQQHRELARVQIVRCRYAIAEGRVEDAVEIVGQMMAMGRHLGSDEFFVSCLVGAAIQGMGVETGLTLSQHPDTPNLYWAIAACPDPAIDLSRAMAFERIWFYYQWPMMKEVTEEVRPAGYWSDFTKRFLKLDFDVSLFYDQTTQTRKPDLFSVATAIAGDYPTAREFLSQVMGFSEEQLDQYPKTQVVFLAMVKYYEFAQDEGMKHFVVPFSNRLGEEQSELVEYWSERFAPNSPQLDCNKSVLFLADVFRSPVEQIRGAAARGEQHQNMWQTVEALRMTAAENGGKFPKSLDQLTVPAPLDPLTGKPFEYELKEGVSILRGAKVGSNRYQIEVELANQNEKEKSK